MQLLHQFKTWMYWKTKIRILQLWSNFKLFNLNNSYIIPILSLIGPIIGVIWAFTLGFGVSYLFDRFISHNPYHLWQIVFFMTIIEAFDRGLQNGRWISSTNEEGWLLACTPFTTTKYLLFLWVDEEIWQNKTQFFSSLALYLGVYIMFPVNIWKLLIVLFFLNALCVMLALFVTLIQYYIIKKSVYLKGRGVIKNIILPFISTILIYHLIKYLMPWIVSFPENISVQFYKEYFNWLQAVISPLWEFSKGIITFFNYDFYPYSLLSNFLFYGDFKSIIYLSFYITAFILINLLMLKIIGNKDNEMMVNKNKTDNIILELFMIINSIFQVITKQSVQPLHVRYFMSSLLRNFLTRRDIFVILGGSLWIYLGSIISIMFYIPEEYKVKAAVIIASLIIVLYPILFLWSVYSKLKIKLSFDAEGSLLQVLMGYGASPEYIYSLKTRTLQILVMPVYVLLLLFTLLFLPISVYLGLLLALVSLLVFIITSKFIVLASFVLPHYEFFNKQQIGEYPDQIKALELIRSLMNLLILPGIPVLLYMTNTIQTKTFVLFSILWIVIGGVLVLILLNNIYKLRLKTFNIEEMSLNRLKVVEDGFWNKRIAILLSTLVIYLITVSLTLIGDFLFAGIFFIIPMVCIKLLLLSSFRKSV